ncbi:PQQ-dependent sugar dehydrogenase [Rubrimonas sp.]|uniref:PQQ-dependent sugar dehydrogenase n=1 Tax=Rubrimonas sp. TaxID=2036015 RepID=UPI002FDCC376
MRQTTTRRTTLWSAMAIGGAALMGAAPAQAAPALGQTTVMTGLESPWDVAFLPDGTMFYTEKCRGLSVRLPSGDVNPLLGMSGAEGFPAAAGDLFCEGQAGMMGVELDPEFESNRFIYVYSTSNMTAPGENRLMRMVVNADLTGVSDRVDLIEGIPYKPKASDHPFGGPGAHNGGRVRFGPDGFLYLTTGDTHNGVVPQSPTMLGGKVLRIDRDGNPAPDNNAPDGFDPRIFTYGHRNVQGISFRPGTGQPVIIEHGPWHSDEVTALTAGGNGGWDPRPNMGGRGDCPDNYCGYSPNQMEGMDPAQRAAFMPMTDFATYPDAMPPAWNNNGLSQGSSSATFLTGAQWGDWEGRFAIGIMGIGFGGTPMGMRIDVVDIAEDGLSVNDVTTMELPTQGRFRSVRQGPDGALYAVVDEGDIYRIVPE